MAGAKTAAKNRRTSATAGRAQNVGEVRVLIPCNRGRNAYVRNVKAGRNPNLRTDSDRFVTEIAALAELGLGDKVRAELNDLHAAYPDDGWADTRSRLEHAGALG